MNVVPFRKYSYLDWVTIAARNNALRVERQLPPWLPAHTDQLWRDFFE